MVAAVVGTFTWYAYGMADAAMERREESLLTSQSRRDRVWKDSSANWRLEANAVHSVDG